MHAILKKPENYRERNVKIGIIQLAGFSLEIAERWAQKAVADHPDIVVLPEIGCGREPESLDDSPILRRMSRYAADGRMYMVINLIEKKGSSETYNTTVILDRQGKTAGIYRKVHIPLATEEQSKQTGGDQLPVFSLDFGVVGMETCFDNYFPETVRSLALAGAEIIFFPHQEHCCWNDVPHVETIGMARAIENVLFMVPSGPTAAEKGVYGRSGIIDPTGKYVLTLPPDKEGYGSATVDLGLINLVSIDWPGYEHAVPMREQMLRNQAKCAMRGRRRPEAYRLHQCEPKQ